MENDVQMPYGYRMQYSPSIKIQGIRRIRSAEKHQKSRLIKLDFKTPKKEHITGPFLSYLKWNYGDT